MKKSTTCSLILILTLSVFSRYVHAQDPQSDPGAYMSAISNAETQMNKAYMAYISASAHSSRKRKIEKLRTNAIDNIVICQNTITGMPGYKGDNSLRQASLTYVQLCYKVFNEDYAHIVNMEDIAERSYDEMHAYLLLQEATDDTLKMGNYKMDRAQRDFAAKYNVQLVSQKTELGDKMEEAGKVAKYRDKVYLLFYKCNWEDGQLTEAVNQKNATKIEQDRQALDKYSKEGIAVLDTLKSFENDGSLANACMQALVFYKDEAEKQAPALADFYLKEENFDKLKSTMDTKPADQRTQKDVDTFNKAVNDINAAVNSFNQTNADLNNGRNQVNGTWEATEKQFFDTHTPYYK